MGGKFFDIDAAASMTINTSRVKVSKAAWIVVEKSAPGVVKIKDSFNEFCDFRS